MASSEQVKAYVASWLQMGKTIDVDRRDRLHQLRSTPVTQNGHYSPEFERNWRFMCRYADRCFLSGTNESIRDLFQERWEIGSCSRCDMLLPLPAVGGKAVSVCPCADLAFWPDLEALQPRIAVLSEVDKLSEESASRKSDMQRVQQRLDAT